MERAHERKAAPRCNDLARSFVYSYCTRYHLGLQASSSRSQCSRLEIFGRSSVKNSTLQKSALSLTQLVPFDNQKPSLGPYRCETIRRPGAQRKAKRCNDISAGS